MVDILGQVTLGRMV